MEYELLVNTYVAGVGERNIGDPIDITDDALAKHLLEVGAIAKKTQPATAPAPDGSPRTSRRKQ